MRRTLAAFLIVAAPAAAFADCAKKSYGAGVTLAESTPVAQLLESPDPWVGRTVRVEGEVVDVCEKAGCWLELRAGAGQRELKVKVEDGEIVFPVSARGKAAVAQGTFERLDMDRARYVAYARHRAEEQGAPFDEASVGEGPFQVYQVAGTGAEICE